MPMEQDSEFITIKAAVREYPFSRTTLYKFHRQGLLTFYARPRQRQTLLKRSELDALSQPLVKVKPG